jgi:cyanophycinase
MNGQAKRLFLCTLLAPALLFCADVGPSKGSLVVVGGGRLVPEIVNRFIELAGGKESAFVYIPTADGAEQTIPSEKTFLAREGCKDVTILHTYDRKVADTEDFTAPLRRARAVWFSGGRQWRLADSYLNTRTHKELWAVLERGGVIGGSSAGATIQGSYLVRGAVEGNTVMMAPGHEEGLGFLRNVGIDQHLIRRKRENDMLEVIDKHPNLLGVGIDESTAIVVQGDQFEVIGASKVAIYDKRYKPVEDGKRYYFLSPGAKFNLKTRQLELP